MVLRRVGRRVVDVLVNGTQVDSFEQTGERADYDVAVSGKSQTITTEMNGQAAILGSQTFQMVDTPSFEQDSPDSVRLSVEASGGDVRISIRNIFTEVASVSGESPDTGWVSQPDNGGFASIKIENQSSTQTNIDYSLRLRHEGISPGFSVDGATQS